MKEYLVLINNEPFTKVPGKTIQDALNYVNERYSFEGLDSSYIVVVPYH